MCWRLHNGARQQGSKGRCCMNTLIPNRMSNEQTRNEAERPAFTSAFVGNPAPDKPAVYSSGSALARKFKHGG